MLQSLSTYLRLFVVSVVFCAAALPAHAAILTRDPYLQLGTPNSIIVRWRTDVPTNGRVRCGPAPGSLSTCAQSPTQTTEHELSLTGLTPATRYYYSVGTLTQDLAGDDADHFFETAPLAGTPQPLRIWVLGDSGTANPTVATVRDAYVTYTGSVHTNLWLMLGDNAYPNGDDVDYQAALFDMFPGMLRTSVLWPTLGNHDVISSDPDTETGPYFEMFSLPTGGEVGGIPSGSEAYYSFDYANVHFVVLDSNDILRLLGGPMLGWLDNDLASTTQPWIVAYWHHPPYSKGFHDSDNTVVDQHLVAMRELAVPILEDHGVDLVLTGHSHSYERSFLIDGHYGMSGTFGPQHLVDGGDGRIGSDGAYRKPALSGAANQGAVYTVAGNAGLVSGGPLGHPAMFVSYTPQPPCIVSAAIRR